MLGSVHGGVSVGRRPKAGVRDAILVLLWRVDAISEGRGSLGQRQIARWIDESPSTVRGHVSAMQSDDLIEINQATGGYSLTGKGKALAATLV